MSASVPPGWVSGKPGQGRNFANPHINCNLAGDPLSPEGGLPVHCGLLLLGATSAHESDKQSLEITWRSPGRAPQGAQVRVSPVAELPRSLFSPVCRD